MRKMLLRLFVTASVLSIGLVSRAEEPDSVSEPAAAGRLTRILFGSCIKQDQPTPIFETILRERPELFLFLGDNIYADTQDMEVMRRKYGVLRSHDGFQRLLKTCPVMATWDDHDYGANDAGADYPQREAAQRLFLDFWNAPANSPRRTRPGIYTARVFGPAKQRVQVLMLDTRYFRSAWKTGVRRVGGPYVPADDPQLTVLGKAQWEWLEAQLRQPAELRILVSSIQCIPDDAGQETWSNFPRERARLFDLIDRTKANGVIMISGDRHWSELSRVRRQGSYPLFELTSSSLNQPHPRGTPTLNQYRIDPITVHRANFGAIRIDWEQDPRLQLQIVDVEGKLQIEKTLRLSQLQPQP